MTLRGPAVFRLTLRTRLLTALLMVAAVAAGSVAFVSSRATRAELHRIFDVEVFTLPPADLVEDLVAGPLREHHRVNGDWSGVEPTLERALSHLAEAEKRRHEAVLFDAAGQVVLAPSSLADSEFELTPEGLEIRRRWQVLDGTRDEVALLNGVPFDLVDDANRAVGKVILLPIEAEGSGFETDLAVPDAASTTADVPTASASRRFLRSVDRWLWVAVGGAFVLAIALGIWLSRRLVAPISDLTEAAHSLGRGNLSRRVEGAVLEERDEIGQLARVFNSMAGHLEQTERLRSHLVSDVAHELRTPLTAARCQLEAIQDGLAQPDRAMIDSLHEEVLHLNRLVDDLQDLAIAEAGGLALRPEAVALGSEIDRVVQACCVEPIDRDRVRIEGDPELMAWVDPGRFRQVLTNLLSNALTHTPVSGADEGRIVIESRSLPVIDEEASGESRSDDRIEVSVSDSGAGIAPEHLDHLFDRFYRADPSRDRATGGAGLGLAIVQQLVTAWGGEVSATSVAGRGSRFAFTVPTEDRQPGR